jgi:low affinity Fe/Cu permease
MIKEIGNKYTPEDLKNKINELIRAQNQSKNDKKECSCEKHYPADFDKKYDKPKSAIDEARSRAKRVCSTYDDVHIDLYNEIVFLYEKAYKQKEKEITISRQTCNTLNEKIRLLEAEIKNKRDLHLALLKTLGVTE